MTLQEAFLYSILFTLWRVKRSTAFTSCLSALEALELFVAYIIIRIFGEVNGANTVFCEEKHRTFGHVVYATTGFSVPKANLRPFAESFFFFQ